MRPSLRNHLTTYWSGRRLRLYELREVRETRLSLAVPNERIAPPDDDAFAAYWEDGEFSHWYDAERDVIVLRGEFDVGEGLPRMYATEAVHSGDLDVELCKRVRHRMKKRIWNKRRELGTVEQFEPPSEGLSDEERLRVLVELLAAMGTSVGEITSAFNRLATEGFRDVRAFSRTSNPPPPMFSEAIPESMDEESRRRRQGVVEEGDIDFDHDDFLERVDALLAEGDEGSGDGADASQNEQNEQHDG